jgi:S-adenosylmethionine/arginine decarboxylase-like enzyme
MQGETFLADIYTCPNFKFNSKRYLKKVLIDIPEAVGLHSHSDTLKIKGLPINGTDKIGFMGVIMLSESHVGIHYWPELNYIRFEISSCKKISKWRLKKILTERFKIKTITLRCSKWHL